jgi:predicted dehydrogenase
MPQMPINQKPALPDVPRPIVSLGAGGIVHDAHLPAYRKAGFQVAGLYDLNLERARALASQFGIERVFPSLESAVNDAPPEAVFDVAVPASVRPC